MEVNETGTKALVMIGVVIAAVLAITSITVYAYPSYGAMSGMMQNSQSWNSRNYMGQASLGARGGMGMNNGMMGGMMMGGGHMGWAGNETSGQHCPGYGAGNSTSGFIVAVANYNFYPQTLKVPLSTTITWINMDTVAHSVESGTHEAPTGLFDSGLLGHMESFSYTFDKPGTYIYHCDPHPSMTGKVIVEE